MKKLIIEFCSMLYWKFWYKIFLISVRISRYDYYKRVYNDVAKVKDIKTNVLTKEQKHEIDLFYKKNYGKKIPYIWHNLIVSYNNKFDVRYITPEIFLEIKEKLNSLEIKDTIFYDKNFAYNFLKKANVKLPKRLFYSVRGLFFNSDDEIISKEDLYRQLSNIGDVFIKPTGIYCSGYARNCRVINVSNGVDIYSKINIKDMIQQYYNTDFIVQERLVCHKSISDIYSKAVNTFSIYSIILDNEIKILDKLIFKIGMNGNVTDYSGIGKEGLIIAINNDGVLYDSALCISQNKWYTSHPDTGFVFKNHKIENFQKISEAVKKLHSCIPWKKFCKWDITMDVDGAPVFIEIEKPAELFQQQILYKEGFFGENTEEILSLLRK
ncbi:MAG: hypothetical protein J6T23_03255 [Elusimicrobia bacterium]|nr:hypothetical protein [Elusimicrobiota bacterium]